MLRPERLNSWVLARLLAGELGAGNRISSGTDLAAVIRGPLNVSPADGLTAGEVEYLRAAAGVIVELIVPPGMHDAFWCTVRWYASADELERDWSILRQEYGR